ncbi:hypothetical protein V4F39_09470 [Aquincola sp. MAHUQ-54]|uniref:Tetratricopeptide repeat protein n=1 Tax=Aquincola agrisoli TaxID=3119538 RepID=A0AAW9QGG0_9BURK
MAAKPLPPEIAEAFQAHTLRARTAWKAGDIAAAEADYLAAWALLPEPKLAYDRAQSMTGGLVKFFRDTHQPAKARPWLERMREAYGPADGTGHVEFMAATVDHEAGDLDAAYRGFHAQYQRFKKRPFEGEDPKYLAFYLKRASGG